MKKLILIFIASAFLGCEPKTHVGKNNSNCIECDGPILSEVRGLSPDEQVSWLRRNQDILCDNEYYGCCVMQFHSISDENFMRYAEDHPENSSNINYYKLSVEDLEKRISPYLTNCYERYVAFNLAFQPSSPKFIEFEEEFNPDKSHYSITLLKEIIKSIKSGQNTSNDSLNICKSIISEEERIIFSVDGVGYFDLSGDPGFLPGSNPSPM